MIDTQVMDAMADAVKEFVADATAPLAAKIAQLETEIASKPDAAAQEAAVVNLVAALGKRFLEEARRASQ